MIALPDGQLWEEHDLIEANTHRRDASGLWVPIAQQQEQQAT